MKPSKNLHFNRVLALFCLALISGMLFAEPSGIIKGRVTDSNNQPIEFATAALINYKTNKLEKGQVSNNKGEFVITKVNPGEYILAITMTGYAKTETEKISINQKNPVVEKVVVLKESARQLANVEVVSKKKFIEQSVDKMIVNPDASITTASENVYEILKKLPGVTVDNSDNISLKGKQNVKVLIDEKPTYVSASQLAAMLKGMQGKNIDRIEIIENPSARYDAEGNSGIINIKTKHNKAPGFNGSTFAGAEIASKFGWNGGLDLNMNYGKFNVYGNYSLYNWAGPNGMTATRNFTSAGLEGAYQLIGADGHSKGQAHNYKMGADYFIKKNHVVSVMFRGSTGHNDFNNNGTTSFADKYMHIDSTLISKSTSNDRWKNQTYNANYKWDIDSTGQSLSADFDYAWFDYHNPNTQDGAFYNSAGNNLNHNVAVNTLQGSNINIYTAKVDYVLPISKKINFEAGLKTSFVNTDSKMDMTGYLVQNDHFIYKEDIQAAYVNGRAQFNKTTLQLGLRLENTISKGTSVATNQVNDTSYLKIFPSFFVQQDLNANNNINFKYSYRIGRPNYDMLNPFKWMIDLYTYNVGNPNLKPQFTHSLGLSHSFKNALITSFGYNYSSGIFTEIIRQNDATKSIYQTNENLNNSIDFNASETVQLQPAKWWRLNGTVTGMYKEIQFNSNTGSKISRWSFNGNMSNNFSLPYKLEMEVTGRYSSEQLISNIIVRPRYTIDLGIQRKVFKDKGTIKVAVSDIFDTGRGSAYAKYDNVDIDVKNRYDSRRLQISFNYNFGKSEFKTRGNRSTASSEEQSRSAK
ncbi:MAG TPA: outer membrane beta-barrel protein [Paludibacter sp.]|nr:outer membrane beta-barrel protein [Paludibacter sp.]